MPSAYSKAHALLNAGRVMILDGGISSELERRGSAMIDGLWSGRSAADHFDTLVDIHRAYIDAGADIITANTYASSRLMLEPMGFGDKVADINKRALEAAFLAREQEGNPDVLVAGSLSHMFPIFGDGTRPGDGRIPGDGAMANAFNEMANLMAEAEADLLLLEMMTLEPRMKAMFDAVSRNPLPVWCGLSAIQRKDGSIGAERDPERSFIDNVAMAAAYKFDVLGVMHTKAALIDACLKVLKVKHDGPIMAYPDDGEFSMPNWHFGGTLSPQALKSHAETWRASGCQILGGCCGLGPDHIRALSALKKHPLSE